LNHVENLHQEVFDFCSYLNQVPYWCCSYKNK